MTKHNEYVNEINKQYGLNLTGVSPLMGAKQYPKSVKKIVIDDFGNDIGRVVYFDEQQRLVANSVEPLLVGLSEVAEILGWSKQQIGVYISRGKFPEPVLRFASGPIWRISDIEEFKNGSTTK